MRKKKILLLGGSGYLIPVISVCHRLDYYVITADYIPENSAHKFSDEYYNISIIDKDAILELAKRLKIDGVMSFACDPGVVTAAYVAEKMKLPFQCSYESAKILQDKGLFRKFLSENKFNCPKAKSYNNIDDALNDILYFKFPVMVKPVDSAGSKGVEKVDKLENLRDAILRAVNISHSGYFIIEEFIKFKNCHSSADCFSYCGDLIYCTYSDQLFDKEASNPYTPTSIIWPSTMEIESQNYLTNEIQRLMNILEMQTGIYNIETCVGMDGKAYIMEVSPRGGGCRIAEIQQLFTGENFIEAEVKKSVGDFDGKMKTNQIDGVWCEYVIHNISNETGIFKEICIDPIIREKYIKMVEISVKRGDFIEPFTGANKSLGDIFLRCDTREELDAVMKNIDTWLKIVFD